MSIKMESTVNHMASDTQKNLKNKMIKSTVLDSFSKLSVDFERERIEGGIILLKHLSQLKDSDEDKKEFKYIVDRLIRGIGSSRISARKGFYSSLVAFLSTMPITTSEVLETLNSQLQTSGNCSKSEKAEIYTGQILVCGAIIRSGLFESSPSEDQSKIIEVLISAGKQRSYLSLACYNFIITLIEKLDESKFNELLWPLLKNEILKPWADQTLDQIYTLFLVHQKFPNIVKSRYLQINLGSPNIIHKDSIKSLCSLLLNIPLNLHLQNPLYEIISQNLAISDCIKEWCIEVNEQLNKPTRNKLLIVLSMTENIIPFLSDNSLIPDLFTSNLILQIIKVQPSMKQKRDFEMNSILLKLFKTLVFKLQNENIEDNIKLAVIKKLLFYPGRFMFEKITSTKVIQQITAILDSKGVKKLSKIYIDIVFAVKPKQNDNISDVWLNSERIYAADLLIKLLNHPKTQDNLKWKLKQMKMLLQIGLFSDISLDENDIGIELAASLKNCFYHSLDKNFLKLEHLRSVLSALIHHINEIIMLPEGNNKLRDPLSNECLQAWETMFTLVVKLENITKEKHNYVIPVFHTLLLHMGLQLFKNEYLALNSLRELHSCYDRVEMNKEDSSSSAVINKENSEPLWTEVIIDLFLNLLSQESHLFRNIIKCVFPHLCSHLNLSAIHQLLDVLDPKNNENPLLNYSSDEDNSSADDNSSIESESSNDENDEDEDENIENSDFEQKEDEENVSDKLRIAVQRALKGTSVDTDDESIDLDDMDEVEGKRLNKALANAFKLYKSTTKPNRSKKQNKVDKALTHFRVKVLDLIELYLDSEPDLSITLEIMLPLLQTLEFAIQDEHQKPLELRLRSCIKKLSTVKKFKSMENVNQTLLNDLIKSLIDKGERTASIFQDMGDKISDCCVFIIRCSQMLNVSDLTDKNHNFSLIVSTLKEALEMFFLKRDCLLPIILFKNTLQLVWDGNWSLIPEIIDFAFNTEIRPFRRNQALELLIIFYCNHRLLKENLEKNEKNLIKIEKSLSQKSLALLEKVATNPKDTLIKEKFVCLLMTLLQNIKHFHNQVQWNVANVVWDWQSIGNAIQSYRSGVSLALDAKKSYNRLCTALGIPNKKNNVVNNLNRITGEGKKIRPIDVDKTSENDTRECENKNKEKKKKRKTKSLNPSVQKQKKETRELRMEMMSEGLGSTLFSSIPFNDIKNTEDINDTLISNETKNTKRNKNSQDDNQNENDSSIDILNQNQNPRKKRKMSY